MAAEVGGMREGVLVEEGDEEGEEGEDEEEGG